MKQYFLLYMEDTDSKSSNMVQWFSEELDAQKTLKDAYVETIQRLQFDTAVCTETHYCGCSGSTAIITDGEDNYSWSVGMREVTASGSIPKLSKI